MQQFYTNTIESKFIKDLIATTPLPTVDTLYKGKWIVPGCYYITEMINGKYLTGPGYRTWVNRWMRLTNNGIGLHDANWRSSFGGSIFLKDGSHGCVNMPNEKAAQLFKEAEIGTITVIY